MNSFSTKRKKKTNWRDALKGEDGAGAKPETEYEENTYKKPEKEEAEPDADEPMPDELPEGMDGDELDLPGGPKRGRGDVQHAATTAAATPSVGAGTQRDEPLPVERTACVEGRHSHRREISRRRCA